MMKQVPTGNRLASHTKIMLYIYNILSIKIMCQLPTCFRCVLHSGVIEMNKTKCIAIVLAF